MLCAHALSPRCNFCRTAANFLSHSQWQNDSTSSTTIRRDPDATLFFSSVINVKQHPTRTWSEDLNRGRQTPPKQNPGHGIHRSRWPAVLLLAATALPGCTVINVYDGNVRVERHLGILYRLDSSGSNRATYLETQGAGLVVSATGTSLGYVNETYIGIRKEDCAAIFIKPTKSLANALEELFERTHTSPSDICVLPERNQSWLESLSPSPRPL